jgi:alpha-N-arabinofuranosidase
MIGTVVATADAVAGRKRSRKRLGLSVDEWNVWHQQANPHDTDVTGPFKLTPSLAEDDQTVADALVVGCLLITLLRHADRVRIGCLAQLVNVIPPIRTLDGGPAWRQSSFFPFMHASRFARGTVLRLEPDAPTYAVDGEGAVSALEATAVLDEAGGALTLFAVNRGAAPLPVEVLLRDLDGVEVSEHIVLTDSDLDASNTAEQPDRVVPSQGTGANVSGGCLRAELPPRSWNVLRLGGGALSRS